MSIPKRDWEKLKQNDQTLETSVKGSPVDDAALEAAINAADTAMSALKLAQDPVERSKLTARLKQSLADAESIKEHSRRCNRPAPHALDRDTGAAHALPSAREPRSTRELPRREQIILLQASFLHGHKFPPWTEVPAEVEFELENCEQYLDESELPLSEFQEEVTEGWKRPADALPPASWRSSEEELPEPTMKALNRMDFVQDAATDCSVVASMCAGAARIEHGHSSLLESILWPYDDNARTPLISKNGKYIVKLNFNGCYRKVVIDDRLPSGASNHIVHVIDKNNPSLLWPALLEKAYLKVRGGYDFPGSNSGTDLWVLSGWIPEQIFLQSEEMEPNRLWERMFHGFRYGDVLVTMGTGKTSDKTERELGLAGEHDYAVLDLREVDGQRLLLIKNPWREGTCWRGKSRAADGQSSQSEVSSTGLRLADRRSDDQQVSSPRDLLNDDDQLSPGTFWMDLDNVLQYFESIYLNWNPALFKHRQDAHFSWDLRPTDRSREYQRGGYASLNHHPQWNITSERGRDVWVLLWRHFQNAVPADATAEEIENDRYGAELKGHIALLAFASGGQRVVLPDQAFEKGWFVDSPQILLKLSCKPNKPITIVPAEQQLPMVKQSMTLSVFGNGAFKLQEATSIYTHTVSLTGSWSKDTSGGNANSPIYRVNPQYCLVVPRTMGIRMLLEACREATSAHLKIVYSRGQRVRSVSSKDIVFDSNDHRKCCAVAEHPHVEAGNYTIICSTFERNQLDSFTLTIESTGPTQTTLLPREGAGRIRTDLGVVSFQTGENSFAVVLFPLRLVKFYAIATQSDQGTPSITTSLIRLSVCTGRGPYRRTLATSNNGEYASSTEGIRTEDLSLNPEMRRMGEIYLVLDRMHSSNDVGEEISVELYVDQPNAVSSGAWQVWDD